MIPPYLPLGTLEISPQYARACRRMTAKNPPSDYEVLAGRAPKRGPWESAEIVYCRRSGMHQDRTWDQYVFISAVVQTDHELGFFDGKIVQRVYLRPGDVFLLDPLAPHDVTGSDVLILIQLVVPRNSWREFAKNLGYGSAL